MAKPDLLFGVAAIADHLGLSARQVKHLHETCEGFPTFKQGRTVCALRSSLQRHFETQAEKRG